MPKRRQEMLATYGALRMKARCLVREPDAGNLHVRFDEQGVETDRLASSIGASHGTAPLPDSTDTRRQWVGRAQSIQALRRARSD